MVMTSWVKEPKFLDVTRRAVETLLASSSETKFDVTVVETSRIDLRVFYDMGVSYAVRYADETFVYNKALNIGAQFGDAAYVVFCSNDLTFTALWWEELLAGMIARGAEAGSPISPSFEMQREFVNSSPVVGCRNGREYSGWCFAMRRSAYDRLGGFAHPTTFWYSDDVIVEQFRRAKVRHVLVPSSVVHHDFHTTMNEVDAGRRKRDTHGQREVYEKWLSEG